MNQLHTRALHDHHRAVHLDHDNGRLRAALALIVEMATNDNSRDVPDLHSRIARVARNALVSAARENPALRNPGESAGGVEL